MRPVKKFYLAGDIGGGIPPSHPFEDRQGTLQNSFHQQGTLQRSDFKNPGACNRKAGYCLVRGSLPRI
jgi:hypothetical protein